MIVFGEQTWKSEQKKRPERAIAFPLQLHGSFRPVTSLSLFISIHGIAKFISVLYFLLQGCSFLVACTQIYISLCRSVGLSVCRSVVSCFGSKARVAEEDSWRRRRTRLTEKQKAFREEEDNEEKEEKEEKEEEEKEKKEEEENPLIRA